MNDLANTFDNFLNKLFYIDRSLTGPGNRETLKAISDVIPINVCEVRSGKKVFDWTIPKEWSVRQAWIADEFGNKIVDYRDNNLHILGYSLSVDKKISFEELRPHLFLHEIPEAVPYRTSYYKDNWGFCITQSQFEALKNVKGSLKVMIDSTHKDGSMSYGELKVEGKFKKSILLSCYICHPSMANDSLSGVVLTTFLSKYILEKKNLQRSYRMAFVPETIGALAYCSNNLNELKDVLCGMVLTTCGGPGKLGIRKSFESDHFINQFGLSALIEDEQDPHVYDFDIHGSDERQYSSPGFGINCITITKDKYYEYPEYHSSLDNLDFVNGSQLVQSFEVYKRIIDKLDKEIFFMRTVPEGEAMLSKYGLYEAIGGSLVPKYKNFDQTDIYLWLLFYANGKTPLSQVNRNLGLSNEIVLKHFEDLKRFGLIYEV